MLTNLIYILHHQDISFHTSHISGVRKTRAVLWLPCRTVRIWTLEGCACAFFACNLGEQLFAIKKESIEHLLTGLAQAAVAKFDSAK